MALSVVEGDRTGRRSPPSRPFDSHLVHSRSQGTRIDSQALGGVASTATLPAALLDDLQDVSSGDILQLDGVFRRRRGRCRCETRSQHQPMHGERITVRSMTFMSSLTLPGQANLGGTAG